MSKEFDAALKDVNAAIIYVANAVGKGRLDDSTRHTMTLSGAILSSARLLALAIRDTGLAADDKWQPPTIEQALGPGG